MIFKGVKEGEYIDADVSFEFTNFVLDGDWAISCQRFEQNKENADNLADAMHENAVKKTVEKFYQIRKGCTE